MQGILKGGRKNNGVLTDNPCVKEKRKRRIFKMSDNSDHKEILEGVLAEFSKLAAIPRKSGHEERIGMFLLKYLKAYNISAERDEIGNIIADIPATAGYEKIPLTILQAHMDMVCIARDGYEYDPLNDPIKLVRTGLCV